MRGNELGRGDRLEIEIEMAVRLAGGEAGLVGSVLGGDDAVEAGAEKGEGERARNDAEAVASDERHQADAAQAGTRLTSQNGNSGTSRRNSR